MKNCPECGCDLSGDYSEKSEKGFDFSDDDHSSIKEELLSEIGEIMDSSLDGKLKSKKPSVTSVEVIAAKPKKDIFAKKDEDEEESF